MVDNVGNGDGAATASVRVLSHYFAHHRREIKRARVSSEDLDSISSLPDVILQVILSLILTKFSIRTSVLSKRWRHVWSGTPSLSFFNGCRPDPDSIDKTLAHYTALKMMSFQLCFPKRGKYNYLPYVDSWIEFAMSRNVENLSLNTCIDDIPNCIYIKRFNINLDPKCSVSWTSLKILSLHSCNLFEESFARILSGSPILETLRLCSCDKLAVLDLSKSPRLKLLEIETEFWIQGAKIVAPHIHSLKFRFADSKCPYTLVDVSSLTEADLDIDSDSLDKLMGDSIPTIMIKLLEKLQNVEKLALGENFLKVLSLANFPGFPFPKFKAKVLMIETTISRYAISGIARVLQHSPEIKKLIIHTMNREIRGVYSHDVKFDGWNPHQLWSWEAKNFEKFYGRNVESKHVALFIEPQIH